MQALMDPIQPSPRTEGDAAMERVYRQTVSPIGPGTRFQSHLTEPLYRWWIEAGGGSAPPVSSFDILDHVRIAPHIFYIRVHDGDRFETRIMGEEAIRLVGENRAGKVLTDSEPDAPGQALWAYYRGLTRHRTCRLIRGFLDFADKSFVRFEGLDCPLVADDGEVVRIVGVLSQLD